MSVISGRRRGFTLAEVVVTAAVLVIIAAITMPSLAGYYNIKNVAETKATLLSLGLALNNQSVIAQDRGFLQQVNTKYPQKLSYLTTPIVSATSTQCGSTVATPLTFGVADVTAWNAAGPFTDINVIANKGVATPLGWVHDSVVKGASAVGTAGWVELHIDSIERADVRALDSLIDTSVDSAAGQIRFVTATTLPNSSTLRLIRFLVSSPLSSATAQIGCP
jgi:prepilin-type N-terminal cleavage/methylation domain-containing protein